MCEGGTVEGDGTSVMCRWAITKGLGRRARVVVVEAARRDDEDAAGGAGRWVVSVGDVDSGR